MADYPFAHTDGDADFPWLGFYDASASAYDFTARGKLTDSDSGTTVTFDQGDKYYAAQLGDYRALPIVGIRAEIDVIDGTAGLEVLLTCFDRANPGTAFEVIWVVEEGSPPGLYAIDSADAFEVNNLGFTPSVVNILEAASDDSALGTGGDSFPPCWIECQPWGFTGSSAIGRITLIAYTDQVVYRRVHPRSDALGASSARRMVPRPRSEQFSNRRAGGYF